jgi:hypothetical protein
MNTHEKIKVEKPLTSIDVAVLKVSCLFSPRLEELDIP